MCPKTTRINLIDAIAIPNHAIIDINQLSALLGFQRKSTNKKTKFCDKYEPCYCTVMLYYDDFFDIMLLFVGDVTIV
jgi:hypothetical protein